MNQDIVPVLFKGLMPTANGAAAFLGTSSKNFVVYIDPHSAQALQMALNNQHKARPLPHDLIENILAGLETKLDHVLFTRYEKNTFYTLIRLRMDNELGKKIIDVDARPSDAITLALKTRRPILVSKPLFDSLEDMSELLQALTSPSNDDEKPDAPKS